jgi:hypothetical protein
MLVAADLACGVPAAPARSDAARAEMITAGRPVKPGDLTYSAAMTISRTVQWTLLTDHTTALEVLLPAVSKAKFTVLSLGPDEISIDVPRAILLDRWAAKIKGTISPDGNKTHIDWRVDGMGSRHYEH